MLSLPHQAVCPTFSKNNQHNISKSINTVHLSRHRKPKDLVCRLFYTGVPLSEGHGKMSQMLLKRQGLPYRQNGMNKTAEAAQ